VRKHVVKGDQKVLKLDTRPVLDSGGIVMFYLFYFAYHIGYLDDFSRGIPSGKQQGQPCGFIPDQFQYGGQ